MKIKNLTKNRLLLDDVRIAKTFFSRLKGLLGKSDLESGEGLIIEPCNSIHTYGMKFPIDVAFVNKEHRVIKIMESVPKSKMSPIVKGSRYVIEARSGKFQKQRLEVGDILIIQKKAR